MCPTFGVQFNRILGFQTTFAVFNTPRCCLSPILCLADRKKLKNGADKDFGYIQSIRSYLACVNPFVKIRHSAV